MSRSPATTDGGARRAALHILLRVESGGAWASALLDRFERRLADPREAGLLHEIVLGVLRHRGALDHSIDVVASRRVAETDPEVRAALRIGAYSLLVLDRVPVFAAVSTAVDLVHGPARRAFVNAVLREVARRGRALWPPPPERGDVAALAASCSFPRWWLERSIARLGWDATAGLAEACNRPAATTLHPASRPTDREGLARRVAELGLAVEPGRFLPDAMRVVAGSPAPIVEAGLAWVQDEAAQLVPLLLGRPYGPRVADLCAAPGGKTLQIHADLVERGSIVAVDRHAGRMRRLAANVRRFASSRVLLVRADAGHRTPLRDGFDQVLLDAPCSGTGTLRRHPEIKWRMTEEDPKLLAVRQAELLASAAGLTRRGGCVVYSVCSLEPEEGHEVVRAFLAARPDFRLGDPRPWLPPAAHGFVVPPGYLMTSPALGDVDGFFAARLERGAP